MDGSPQMLWQWALKTKALKESVVGLYAFRNLGKGLPFSHFSEQFPLVLIKSRGVKEVFTARNQG